jgi:hypothetical protein
VVGSFIPTSLQWASKSVALPAGTNRLIFRGVSMHGNYLYLDNIVIAGSCSPANTPTAVITPSGPTTFCQGGSVTLAASGGTNYQWSTGSSSSSLVASTSGMYTVTVTNSSGCTDSESATVTVNPGVTVDVQIAADINPAEEGELVTFAAASQNGGTTPVYQWRVNGTTAGSNAASFSYVPVDDDSVYCILLSNADCAIDNPDTSNVVIMEVIPLPVLSLISPNGGESWTQGSQQVIAWNDNFSEPVKIELYKAGEYVMTLAAATPSTGSFGWTVPLDQKAGGDYTIRITNTGNSAVSDESDQYFSIAAIIPENQLIQDLTVANGADTCIAASQTITVAGGGSSVTVQTAGSLTCIAGQRILIFPGTYIYEGAFFSAFISLTGEYCDSPYAPLTKESIWSDNINSKKEAHFKVYPNPCFDWIHVVANGVQTEEKAILTIHRSDGRLVRKTDFEPGRTFNFCHELKPGIYTVGLSYAGTADYQLLVVIE